jgi:hypothetical protein
MLHRKTMQDIKKQLKMATDAQVTDICIMAEKEEIKRLNNADNKLKR